MGGFSSFALSLSLSHPFLSLSLYISLSLSLSLSLPLSLSFIGGSLSFSLSLSICLSLPLSLYPHTSVLLTPSLSIFQFYQPSCSFLSSVSLSSCHSLSLSIVCVFILFIISLSSYRSSSVSPLKVLYLFLPENLTKRKCFHNCLYPLSSTLLSLIFLHSSCFLGF